VNHGRPRLCFSGLTTAAAVENYREIDELENSVETKFEPCSVIWIIGWDALGGYVFARMAQNQGQSHRSLQVGANIWFVPLT
jgi:hypothetical protein